MEQDTGTVERPDRRGSTRSSQSRGPHGRDHRDDPLRQRRKRRSRIGLRPRRTRGRRRSGQDRGRPLQHLPGQHPGHRRPPGRRDRRALDRRAGLGRPPGGRSRNPHRPGRRQPGRLRARGTPPRPVRGPTHPRRSHRGRTGGETVQPSHRGSHLLGPGRGHPPGHGRGYRPGPPARVPRRRLRRFPAPARPATAPDAGQHGLLRFTRPPAQGPRHRLATGTRRQLPHARHRACGRTPAHRAPVVPPLHNGGIFDFLNGPPPDGGRPDD